MEIRLLTFISGVFIALVVLNASCLHSKEPDTENPDKLKSWKMIISDLNVYMNELENKKAEVQSFIETAEVHQVTRSKDEKTRQLHNLNLHKTEIEFKIDSTKTLINIYTDSIHNESK